MNSKRLAAAVCSAALTLSMAGAPALQNGMTTVFADEYTQAAKESFGDYEYELQDDGTVSLYKYIGKDTTVTVPSTLDGKKVTRLSNLLFNGNKNVKEITVPGCITRYDSGSTGGNGIFRGCTSLEKVNLPANMTEIPDYTFAGCTALKSIDLPAKVKEIGYAAFSGCTALNNVEIPAATKIIQPLAFKSCTSLTNIYIPATCTEVGYEKSSVHEWDPFKGIEDTVVITTEPGSAAETYAKTYGRKYRIKRTSIEGAVLTVAKAYYTGKSVTPAVTVKLNGKTLVRNTDYTVSYKNNKKVGKAAVTVKGKNSYEGSVSKTFIIRPGQNKIVKLTSPKTKQLKVKWKKDPQVTGYEVRVALNKTFSKGLKKVTIKKNTTVAKTFKGLKKGKAYYARIRAYKSIDGKAYYGKFSPVKKLKIK